MIFAFVTLYCSSNKTTDDYRDTTSLIKKADEKDSIYSQDYSMQKSLIQGLWAVSEDANASFRVKGDSLYYFEDPVPVFFEIKMDSFIYYVDGEKFFNKIVKLQSDSIVFIENGELMRLYNREKK